MRKQFTVGEFALSEAERAQVGTSYPTVEVSVVYTLGGYGGLDWTLRKRGYQLHVTPCEKKDGFRTTSIGVSYGSGGFIHIEDAARFNARRCAELGKSVSLAEVKQAFLSKSVEALKATVRARIAGATQTLTPATV